MAICHKRKGKGAKAAADETGRKPSGKLAEGSKGEAPLASARVGGFVANGAGTRATIRFSSQLSRGVVMAVSFRRSRQIEQRKDLFTRITVTNYGITVTAYSIPN